MEEEILSLLNEISYYLKFKVSKSYGQKKILLILSEEEVITQSDLTYRLGLQSSSISEILEKMESKGLIYRQQSKRDRRTLDVFLTEKGLDQAHEADREYDLMQQYLFTGFTSTEKEMLRQLLNRLLSNLENNLYSEYSNTSSRDIHHKGHRHFHKHGHKHVKHPKHRKF